MKIILNQVKIKKYRIFLLNGDISVQARYFFTLIKYFFAKVKNSRNKLIIFSPVCE